MSFATFTRKRYDFDEQKVLESELATRARVRIALNASNLPTASVRVVCEAIACPGISNSLTLTPDEARALADELNIAADTAQGLAA